MNDRDYRFPEPGLLYPGALSRSQSGFYNQTMDVRNSERDCMSSTPIPQGFAPANSSHSAQTAASYTPAFPHLTTDAEFAEAFSNFSSCHDCTPATMTAIPHHHHSSGRLGGASATLDGHFCCSWLVHGQPCFLCFESAEALDNHIKTDHAGKDGTYRCLWQDCSKHNGTMKAAGEMNFGNKPKLMRHVHSHTGYKPFPCTHPGCDRGFVTKEQLRNHETTHTKSRQYTCEHCGKAFAVKSALTTHITAVHDEKKIHSCEICGKAFADSSNLSKHKQTHYRETGTRKRRNTRDTPSMTSTCSSPTMSTLSVATTTPILGAARLLELSRKSDMPGLMAPPMLPKLALPSCYTSIPTTYSSFNSLSTASSPPPEPFDPDCYCCDQQCPLPDGAASPCKQLGDCDLDSFCCDERCTPPNGLVAPCPEPERCELEGFCDLPECLPVVEPSVPGIHSRDTLLHHHQIEQLHDFRMPMAWNDTVDCCSVDHPRPVLSRDFEQQLINMYGT